MLSKKEGCMCAVVIAVAIVALVVFLIAGGICLYGTWIMSVRLGW